MPFLIGTSNHVIDQPSRHDLRGHYPDPGTMSALMRNWLGPKIEPELENAFKALKQTSLPARSLPDLPGDQYSLDRDSFEIKIKKGGYLQITRVRSHLEI